MRRLGHTLSPRDGHEQRDPIRGSYVPEWAETDLLVATDGPGVLGIGIGLHLRDVRIVKEVANKRGHQLTSESLSELAAVGKKLVNTTDTRVSFVLPPSISALDRDVRLDKPKRFACQEGNVALNREVRFQARQGRPLFDMEMNA